MKILSGKDLADQKLSVLADEVKELVGKRGRQPKLTIILVGDNPDSKKYVNTKRLQCEKVGVLCDICHFQQNVSEAEVIEKIDLLNQDDTTDGILLQLPLPAHLESVNILEHIDYKKDADGLNSINMGFLAAGKPHVLPCTPKGIISLLKHYDIPLDGKRVVVVGRSNLVGKPTAQLMLRENATVTLAHSKTENLADIVATADIVVSAMGKTGVLTPEMLPDHVVLVDVGMNRQNGILAGDVYCAESLSRLESKVAAVTPVPAGVGPMTIASLLENVVDLYKARA